jgi:hypothetical protein
MTAEENLARGLTSYGRDSRFESLLVAFCAAGWWWAGWARLAKGQIAAEGCPSRIAKRRCQSYEKGRVAVGSRAMGQNECIPDRIGWEMKEAANRRLIRRVVVESLNVAHMRA